MLKLSCMLQTYKKNSPSSHFTNMQLFFSSLHNAAMSSDVSLERMEEGEKMNGGWGIWHGNSILLLSRTINFLMHFACFFMIYFKVEKLQDSLEMLEKIRRMCVCVSFLKSCYYSNLIMLTLFVTNRNSFFRCNILKSFIFFALIQCIDWWWKMLEAYFTHCCFSYPFILHSL